MGIRDGVPAIVVSAPIEEEIARLDGDEQAEFLAELGLGEPSVHRVIRASYEILGLISFFTVGEDEVRAWTIRRGTVARRAAGAIHSDLERGFIRAEVVPWQDLIEHRSLAACRQEASAATRGQGVRDPRRRHHAHPLGCLKRPPASTAPPCYYPDRGCGDSGVDFTAGIQRRGG